MTPEQEEFYTECPAWARRLGIKNLRLWQIVVQICSFNWEERFDFLARAFEEETLTLKESGLIRKVLEAWDEMTEPENTDILHPEGFHREPEIE